MKFFRKGGRIIPIRDEKNGSRTGRIAGGTIAAGGAALAVKGVVEARSGIRSAGTHFREAAGMAQKYGLQKVKSAGENSSYAISKMNARAGARKAVSGSKKYLAGAAITAVGSGIYAASKKKEK